MCKKPNKMKTATTPNPLKQNSSASPFVLAIASLLFPFFLSAQNLVTNSSFTNGTTGWTSSCSIEVYDETVYGGSNAANNVTEIDKQRCIDQDICILPGITYKLTFKGSRRIDASTPASPGISIEVTGVNSNTVYVNQTKAYSNTSFGWSNQSYTFSVPANSSDKKVNIHFADDNNHSTYGVVIDDIELHPQTDMAISGATTAVVGTGAAYSYSVSNTPSSSFTYNWSMGANATNATSTLAAPSTSWTTTGTKNLSVVISNSTCVVTTLSAAVVVTGILPVTFTSFSGVIKDNKAALTWSTAQEANNSYFIIERSANGRSYDSVGRVQAGSRTSNTYSFTEDNTNAISYYRLKQVDLSGTYTYSTVITLKNASGSREMTVYPAQATSTIQYVVTNDAQAKAMVQVFTITGQPVINQQEVLLGGLNVRSVNVSNLAKGAYFLKLDIPALGVTMVKQFQKL
jgi:hypothetical protein